MSDYPGLDFWDLTQQIVSPAEGPEYLPWDILEDAFGPLLWEKFSYWMRGQTVVPEGAYPWDVERFCLGLPIID